MVSGVESVLECHCKYKLRVEITFGIHELGINNQKRKKSHRKEKGGGADIPMQHATNGVQERKGVKGDIDKKEKKKRGKSCERRRGRECHTGPGHGTIILRGGVEGN